MNPLFEKVIQDRYGKKTAESYDRLAYDFFWSYAEVLRAGAFHVFYEKLSHLKSARKIEILDLGTGTGNLCLELLQLLKKFSTLKESLDQDWQSHFCITLQDKSAEMLQVAKEKIESNFHTKLTLVNNDMQSFLNFDKKYDVIMTSFAVHHLSPIEKRELIDKVAMRLHPGGVFLLIDRMNGIDEASHQKFVTAVSSMFFSSVGGEVSLEQLNAAIEEQFLEDGDQPDTIQEHLTWLNSGRFSQASIVYESGPIACFLAKKS